MENIRQLYAFISTSKIRKNVLGALSKKDIRQVEIAKSIKEKQPNVSKALADLQKKKLVECLTPEKKAWKVYGITDLGRQVLKYRP
ncbi:hypothetical protein A3K73_06265 [Candidatus Pacearchaeota archaeon RBG_13_36_9]|nr:MAG: hypothetical protein A3K73_06265 [Candidatus Pacearchaeota archaeon RBG_13_36_9]